MGKLHEVLAAEKQHATATNKLLVESKRALGKDHLFTGSTKRTSMLDVTREDENTDDITVLDSTVYEYLGYLNQELVNYWDLLLSKEESNQRATADIIVDDKVLAKDVPATYLLGLETKLAGYREILDSIPTLAPGIDWILDDQNRKGVYKTNRPNVSFRTEKELEYVVVTEPTDHHPAQVKERTKTHTIARVETTKSSGMMTPLEKASTLTRLDKLLNAVRRARSRANQVEVKSDLHVSRALLTYIHGEDLIQYSPIKS